MPSPSVLRNTTTSYSRSPASVNEAGVLGERDRELASSSRPSARSAACPASIGVRWRNPVVFENTSTSKRGCCTTAANGSICIAAGSSTGPWSWPGCAPARARRRTPSRDERDAQRHSNPHRPQGDFDAEPSSCFPPCVGTRPRSPPRRVPLYGSYVPRPGRRCLHTGRGLSTRRVNFRPARRISPRRRRKRTPAAGSRAPRRSGRRARPAARRVRRCRRARCGRSGRTR